MIEDTPPETVPETVTERAEAAATRRRWVSLAELVGVAGLIIAALGLWLGWSDRRADDSAKQAEQATEAKVRTLVMLKATIDGDDLKLTDAAHDVQEIDVRFPKSLGVARRAMSIRRSKRTGSPTRCSNSPTAARTIRPAACPC